MLFTIEAGAAEAEAGTNGPDVINLTTLTVTGCWELGKHLDIKRSSKITINVISITLPMLSTIGASILSFNNVNTKGIPLEQNKFNVAVCLINVMIS